MSTLLIQILAKIHIQTNITNREKVLQEVGAKAEVRVATVAKRRLATEVFMVLHAVQKSA